MLPMVKEYVKPSCLAYEDDDIIIFYSIFFYEDFKYYIALDFEIENFIYYNLSFIDCKT